MGEVIRVETYFGIRNAYIIYRVCDDCDGTGKCDDADWDICPECNGNGYTEDIDMDESED